MNFIVSAVTDKGKENVKNQDSVVVRSAMTGCGHMCVAVICDGLGGLSQGEVASAHVAGRISKWFMNGAGVIKNVKMAVKAVRAEILKANEELVEYGRRKGYAVGTTATVLVLAAGRYGFVHIGDTRIYQMRYGCKAITRDHCINERVLTQCVGGSDRILPQMGFGRAARKSIFLLCSDGFRHKNDEKVFSSYYRQKDNKTEEELRMHTELLVERCRYLGEKDNVTAVVIKVM